MGLRDLISSVEPTDAQPLGQATAESSRVLAAKSGKALNITGPAASNLAEQAEQGKALAVQQEQKNQAVTTGLAQQQQEVGIQREQQTTEAQTESWLTGQKQQLQQQAESIMDNLSRSNRQLDTQMDSHQLEQLGFAMRLSSDKYVYSIQDQGRRQRIEDGTAAQVAIQQAVWGNQLDQLSQNQQFTALLNADSRTFKDQLANMDLGFAMQVAAASNTAANQQAMASGVGSATSAGLKGWEKYGSKEDTGPEDKNEETVTNDYSDTVSTTGEITS